MRKTPDVISPNMTSGGGTPQACAVKKGIQSACVLSRLDNRVHHHLHVPCSSSPQVIAGLNKAFLASSWQQLSGAQSMCHGWCGCRATPTSPVSTTVTQSPPASCCPYYPTPPLFTPVCPAAMCLYSCPFMRFAWMVQPALRTPAPLTLTQSPPASCCPYSSPPHPVPAAMCLYSCLFRCFAWMVQPRSFLLLPSPPHVASCCPFPVLQPCAFTAAYSCALRGWSSPATTCCSPAMQAMRRCSSTS